MSVIAHNVTHDVCSHCGEVAGIGAHGHSDAPGWRWLEVEYVPADQLTGAVCLSDDEWDRVVWWLSQPVPPSPMKALDEAILRKIAAARGGSKP